MSWTLDVSVPRCSVAAIAKGAKRGDRETACIMTVVVGGKEAGWAENRGEVTCAGSTTVEGGEDRSATRHPKAHLERYSPAAIRLLYTIDAIPTSCRLLPRYTIPAVACPSVISCTE